VSIFIVMLSVITPGVVALDVVAPCLLMGSVSSLMPTYEALLPSKKLGCKWKSEANFIK